MIENILNPAVSTETVERSLKVVKANHLVRNGVFDMSTKEQKLILFLISKVRPTDTDFLTLRISFADACKIFGIEVHGQNYIRLEAALQELANKSVWFRTDKGKKLFRWLQNVEIFDNPKEVKIRLSDDLKPYLLKLKNNTTRYELVSVLPMTSKYAIRLYEILQSYASLKEFIISISDLKVLLHIQPKQYSNYKNFRVNVIDKSIEEINRFTGIMVKYEPIRTSRTITSVHFFITSKSSYDRFMSLDDAEKTIDKRSGNHE